MDRRPLDQRFDDATRDETDQLLRDTDSLLEELSLDRYGDPNPPTPRERRIRNALVLTAALMIGGTGLATGGWFDSWGIWDDPGADTAATPGNVCTAPDAPTVDAVPSDTSVTATGSAFSENCTSGSDTHESSDWWVTGPLPSAPNDTVAEAFTSDSLTRYTNLSTTLLTDSTYVLHGRYTGAVGGTSAEGVDTFVATAAVVREDVCFHSAWSYALGDSTAALTDSARWSSVTGNGTSNAIVVDTSTVPVVGWPTARGLLTRINGSALGRQINSDSVVACPAQIAVDESRYIRFAFAYVYDSTDVEQTVHSPESMAGGGIDISWNLDMEQGVVTDTTHVENLTIAWSPSAGEQAQYDLGGLRTYTFPKDTAAVLELQVWRTFVDSIQLHARLWMYDAAGDSFALRWDDDDFPRRFGGGTTLADSLNIGLDTAANWDLNIKAGVAGFDSDPGYVVPFQLQGTMAQCDSVWCGLYPIAGVEN